MRSIDVAMQPALFRLAFRPFFLGGALFAFLAIGLWWALWLGYVAWQPYGGMLFWHAHEMLFGFICAIIAGFLLTAVQNWTGIAGLKGWPLVLLFLLWLGARVTAFFAGLPYLLHAGLDLSFLPVVAIALARPIVAVKQWRNLFFVPLLLLLTLANLSMHAGVWLENAAWIRAGQYGGIGIVAIVVSVLGGRVIPFFTANATGTHTVAPLPWLEWSAVGALAAGIVLYGFGAPQGVAGAGLTGLLLVSASLLQLWRWYRWRFWLTGSTPLLWSLHLAYLFLPLGLLAVGLNAWGWLNNLSANVHLITVGAFGGLIVAMMSRVSLGHTGRPLRPLAVMTLAYLAVPLAALLRGLGMQFWPPLYTIFFSVSALAWMIGFGIFLLVYWPVLTRPRIDGKSG